MAPQPSLPDPSPGNRALCFWIGKNGQELERPDLFGKACE